MSATDEMGCFNSDRVPSLARDMKTALQEADEAEEEGKVTRRDAKGREILTEEEKAKRDAKKRAVDEEVRVT